VDRGVVLIKRQTNLFPEHKEARLLSRPLRSTYC